MSGGPQSVRSGAWSSDITDHVNPARSVVPDYGSDGQLIQQIESFKQENESLKNMVQRYRSQLEYCQARHPDLVAALKSDIASTVSDGTEPWILDSKWSEPLLVSYEARVKDMEAKNAEYKRLVDEMKTYVTDQASTNDDLRGQLEEAYERLANRPDLLDNIDPQTAAAAGMGVTEIKELKKREELLRTGRALLLEKQDALRHDYDELRKKADAIELEKEQLADRLQEMTERYDEAAVRLRNTAAAKENLNVEYNQLQSQAAMSLRERERLHAQIRGLKKDLKAAGLAHSAHRQQQEQTVRRLKNDIVQLRNELQGFNQRDVESSARIEHLEKACNQVEDKNREANRRLEANHRDLEGMVKSLEAMENTLTAYKQREVSMLKRESEAKDLVAEAELARDQALAREQQKERENQRLQERMRNHVEDVKKTSEASIAHIYQRSKETEKKLREQITALELACADLEGQRDQAVKDANSTRAELQRVSELARAEQVSLNEELHKVMSQVATTTAEHEIAVEKADRARHELKRLQTQWLQEKELTEAREKDYKLKIDSQSLGLKDTQERLFKVQDHNAILSCEVEDIKKETAAQCRMYRDKIAALEVAKAKEFSDLQQRLEEAYQMHEESEARATEFLQAQEQMAAKWRDENKNNILHFQRLLREAKEHQGNLQARIDELDNRVYNLTRQRDEAMAFQKEHEDIKNHLETQLEDVNTRLDETASQLSAMMLREPELLAEQQRLSVALDRERLDNVRNQRRSQSEQRRLEFENKALALQAANFRVDKDLTVAGLQGNVSVGDDEMTALMGTQDFYPVPDIAADLDLLGLSASVPRNIRLFPEQQSPDPAISHSSPASSVVDSKVNTTLAETTA